MPYPLGTVTANTVDYTEEITATGSWTAPTDAAQGFTAINMSVEVIAAGGGSAPAGGLDSTGPSGSGGGAYSKLNTFSPTAGTNYTSTVGVGAANAVGGDSWFSTATTVMAKGGNKGVANGGAVGTGGASASGFGDTKYSGGNGGVGALAAGGAGGGGAGSGGAGGNASGTTAGTGTATGGGGGGTSAGGAGAAQGGGGGGSNGLGGGSGPGGRGYVLLRYNKYFKPTGQLATMPLVGTQSKQLTLFRTSSAALPLLAATNRYVKPIAKVATLPLLASKQFYVRLSAKVATLPLTSTTNRYVRLIAKVATLPLVGAFSRRLEMGRMSSAPVVLTASTSKSLILVRLFVATMTMTAKTFIQMPQDALNRITGGGGTTIIKKIFTLLD